MTRDEFIRQIQAVQDGVKDFPKMLEESAKRISSYYDRLTKAIEEKDAKEFRSISLYRNNPTTRKHFQDLTGLTLPRGAKATDQVVREWLGKNLIDLEEAERLEQEKKAEAKRLLRQAEAELAVKKFESGEKIDSDQFVEALKLCGIDLHPRTHGMIKKRVGWVSLAKISSSGGKKIASRVIDLAQALERAIVAKKNPEPEPTPEEQERLNHLFGKTV